MRVSLFVGAGLAASGAAAFAPSSPRKTINYGPVSAPRTASVFGSPPSLSDSSVQARRASHLIRLNSASTQSRGNRQLRHGSSDEAAVFGATVAEGLLRSLHPKATFEVTNRYVSAHSQVAHVYFIQTVSLGEGAGVARISNAQASAHVDVDPTSPRFGHVLSYSESFHDVSDSTTTQSERPINFHHVTALVADHTRRHGDWTAGCEALQVKVSETNAFAGSAMRQQVVFGSSAGASEDDVAALAACQAGDHPFASTVADVSAATNVVDPRIALISFLTVVGDSGVAASLGASSLDDLVNSMIIRHPLHSESGEPHQIEVLGAPGTPTVDEEQEVTTKGELAYLSVEREDGQGRELQLVWRFEYRSELNMYEGYVDATRPGLVPSSIDWVRDFRPTSEVANSPTEHFAMLSSLRAALASPGAVSIKSKNKSPKKKPSEPVHPTYRVFPWSVNDPSEGDRDTLTDPAHTVASEVGWHSIPPTGHGVAAAVGDEDWYNQPGWSSRTSRGMNATDTRGNNVFAQENWEGLSRWENNGRPDGTDSLTFDFPLHWGAKENRTGRHIEPKSYIDASVTELFFTCNEVHDLFYLYGFDELAGNFQEMNFGRGGKGGDAVIANAQDGSGYNNANFATPPDGQHGQMRMYVWNGAEPWRDGDLEAGIVIHEYAHGISTRLTGGPANSGCLGWGEAGGMGEGWGDTFATLIRMHKKKPVDFSMGEWASGMAGGIRKYKYSLNHTTNTETYSVLDKPGYWGVHAIGEVWAEMLYTVAEALIKKHGFEHSLFPPANTTGSEFYTTSKTKKQIPRKGNTLFLQLVVDGMKLQPCRPSFTDARDAILQADDILTGSENACEIWTAFASRGLGPDAALRGSTPWGGGVREEDYSVPKRCSKKK